MEARQTRAFYFTECVGGSPNRENKSKSDDKETVNHAGVHHHGEEDRRGLEFHKRQSGPGGKEKWV